MQELTIQNYEKLYAGLDSPKVVSEQKEVTKTYNIPESMTGVKFNVSPNYKGKTVLLTVDEQEITLTLQGALDLARGLRETANKIGAEAFKKKHK